MRNPMGVMHGGAVAGALDITMGSLTFYCSGEFVTPTININVSYERPIATGKRLFVEATCLSCGKTMAYACCLRLDGGAPEKTVMQCRGHLLQLPAACADPSTQAKYRAAFS
mgnify:CR=1 FL=1